MNDLDAVLLKMNSAPMKFLVTEDGAGSALYYQLNGTVGLPANQLAEFILVERDGEEL